MTKELLNYLLTAETATGPHALDLLQMFSASRIKLWRQGLQR